MRRSMELCWIGKIGTIIFFSLYFLSVSGGEERVYFLLFLFFCFF